MSKSNQEVSVELVGESLLPKENTFVRRTFPRISFISQDVTEGKGKSMKVTVEAGTYFTEKPTNETDEKGKKVWEKTEIGKKIEGVVFFTRKKLSYYDQPNNKFYTSSYYDQDTDIIPLWSDGKKIAEGTKKELQAPYNYTKEDGKSACRLVENKVLYVYFQEEVYELTIKGTSAWEYSKYYKDNNTEPNKNLTEMAYEDCENGAIVWSKITFKRVRQLNQAEWDITRRLAADMLRGIAEEKAYFASVNTDVPALVSEPMWDPNVELPAVSVAVLGDGKEF